MQFPSALDLVLKALERIQEDSEQRPRASRVCIEQLLGVGEAGAHNAAFAESPHPAPSPPTSDSRSPERSVAAATSGPCRTAPAGSIPRGRGEGSARISEESKAEALNAMNARVSVCTKCPHLASSRTQTVFGVGNPDADLMFVGEAPGADEDAKGEPFVGRAGQLLTKIIETMGFARGDVYIANVLKCRPDMPRGSSGNRPPTLAEMETCKPFLLEQIEIIQPKVMVALGATAVEGLLGMRSSMRDLRGRWHDCAGKPLMITYHPAYLLRNQSPSEKRKVWEDMLLVLERLEQPITEKQRNYFR